MGVLSQIRLRRSAQPAPVPSRRVFAEPRHVSRQDSCFFYHTTDLPGLGVQEGAWDLRGRFLDYVGGVDFLGKRVLDVGAASGFLSFEAERHGAAEVVSFDLDTAERQTLLPFAESDYVNDYPGWCARQTDSFRSWHDAYWLTHRLLKSRARAVYGDVYEPPAEIGMFDIVILGAILEHLVDPLSALTALARHASDIVVINTDFLDEAKPVAAFNGRADLPAGNFIFWTYSIAVYDEYMKIMGFRPVAAHRGVFAGTRSAADAPRPMLPRVALVYQREGKIAARH